MMGDDPPYLAVGTDVSAKYKGAFCEAKIRKISRHVKCKVTFKSGLGLAPATIPDDQIRGTLRLGQVVEAKPDKDKNTYYEATITRIQDSSMYTVVFDDGDITTLRRSALCLKSGRHFNESETLDQLPLTHPEHFLNPVVGGRRGGRRRLAKNDADKDDSSDEEDTPSQKGKKQSGTHSAPGRVVYVENTEKKKGKDSWFPGLIVSPCAQDTVKIRVKDECLVRSFKDGRYYTVPKKEITEFLKEQHGKLESISNPLKSAVEKAIAYLDKDELPPHWDRDVLFGNEDDDEEDDNNSDIEGSEARQQEENDLFLANLHRFHEESGTPFTKPPSICNKELDIGKLFKIVTDQGGHDKITNGGQWKNVTMKLGLGNMPSTSTVNLVKKNYKRFLYDYEKSSDSPQSSQQSIGSSKSRNSRSQNRIGGTLSGSKESIKKDEIEMPVKIAEEKDVRKSSIVEPEGDTASVDSTDTKKSEASSATNEEPRRSRSRQESRSLMKKDSIVSALDDKGTSEGKKKSKKISSKEKDKEETSSIRAEPPSPAPSSQGSKKGRGGSRKKKEKEDEDVTAKEPPKVEEPIQTEGLSKDVKIQVGDKLSVFYPNGDQPMTYEAKAIEMCPNRGYLVHYTGWNTRYDEWIKRNRISENLSLRANYQGKSQGKGPASQSTSTSGIKEKEKDIDDKLDTESGKLKGSSKKKGRTTPAPSPSVSSTGTRSKSGTVKRKRLSAEFEEPVKKKRSSKKSEKDTNVSGSESDASDSEQKSEKVPKSGSPGSSTTPSKTGKSQKEKKLVEESESEVKSVSKEEDQQNKSTTSDSDDKDKPTQPIEVVDMVQIRSEMKGLHNIVKSKSASSIPSTPSGSSSQLQTSSSSVSVSGGQKLDIYDFEEELNDAPKLKMFSPRSPDKKEDGASKVIGEPTIPIVKVPSTEIVKSKDTTAAITAPSLSMPKTDTSTAALKIVAAKIGTPTNVPPRPPTPGGLIQSSKNPAVVIPTTTPPILPQSRGLLAVSPAIGSGGQRVSGVSSPQLTEVKVRMGVPVPFPQHRPRPPMSAAPSPVVSSLTISTASQAATPPLVQGVGPSAGVPVHSSVAQSQPTSISKRTPKIPPGKPLLKPKPGLITPSTTAQVSAAQDTSTTKDPIVLPPQVRTHELFPHLIQREKLQTTSPLNSAVPVQAPEPITEKVPALSYSGPITLKSDKYSTGGATVLNIPTIKPTSKPTPSSETSKPEKQKRAPSKDKLASVSQASYSSSGLSALSAGTESTPTTFQLHMKKVPKPEVTKPSSSTPVFTTQTSSKLLSKPSVPQKLDAKKDVKAPSSEALSKINDTISSLMQTSEDKPSSSGKRKKSEKIAEEKPSHKEGHKETKTKQEPSSAKSSDKRSSPIKTHFLKDPAAPAHPEKSISISSDNLITSKTSVIVHKMKLDSRQTDAKSKGEASKPLPVSADVRTPSASLPVATTTVHAESKSSKDPQPPSSSVLQISKLSTLETALVPVTSTIPSTTTPKLIVAKANITATPILSQADKLSLPTSMSSDSTKSVFTKSKQEETPPEIAHTSPEVNLASVKLESIVTKDVSKANKESSKTKTPTPPKESIVPPEIPSTSKVDTTTTTSLSNQMDRLDDDIKPEVGMKTAEPTKHPEVSKAELKEERPLTPSFLTAREELAPDFEDEPVEPKHRTSRRESTAGHKYSDSSKEDESCSSLLCEEEIPGSPTVDEEGRSKFDFVDDEEEQEKTSLRDPSRADKSKSDESPRVPSKDNKELKEDKHKSSRREFAPTDEALSAMEKEFLGSQDHSSPSTPESTSLSVETGGSPNIEGRGISPSGEGGSSKSKESTDGESHSGDGSKSYFGEDLPRKKSIDPSASPAGKRTKDSRGRLSSPPPKRRRIPRKKSPEEVARPIHRGRGSSNRKAQPVGNETPEAVRPPLPPPLPFEPLVRPQVQSKWEHLIPNLDGVTDSEERALIIYTCMMKAKEKYIEIRQQEQARERRLKRLRRKERERAAAEKQALKSQEVKVVQ